MLTKKDRKIRNQKSMIHNRDILIRDMECQAEALYKENKEAITLIKRINMLVSSNKYNNEKAVLNKIKELVSDYQSIN